jgi:hypothetical protein
MALGMALTAESALPLQKETTDKKRKPMPAKDIMPMFRKHRLHSGSSGGPIVKDEHQAKAIQLSYARKEGADIPEKKSKPPKRKSVGEMIAEG